VDVEHRSPVACGREATPLARLQQYSARDFKDVQVNARVSSSRLPPNLPFLAKTAGLAVLARAAPSPRLIDNMVRNQRADGG
jgi:hypothetical protein